MATDCGWHSPCEPKPLDFCGVFCASMSPFSPPAYPTLAFPATTCMETFGLSLSSLPFGRIPETAAEPSISEQQLLDFHRQQGTFLATWSQQ